MQLLQGFYQVKQAFGVQKRLDEKQNPKNLQLITLKILIFFVAFCLCQNAVEFGVCNNGDRCGQDVDRTSSSCGPVAVEFVLFEP